jgi:hypothetical protein
MITKLKKENETEVETWKGDRFLSYLEDFIARLFRHCGSLKQLGVL